MTRGFSLVEVLVALVVLEVGLLGVMGVGIVASRTLSEAHRLERAIWVAEAVADSLQAGATTGGGHRALADLTIDWSVRDSGRFTVEATTGPDTILRVFGRVDGHGR